MTIQFYSLGDAARLLGVQPYQISYAISTGAIPDALCWVAGKRCFTPEEIRRMAEHFGTKIADAFTVESGKGEM